MLDCMKYRTTTITIILVGFVSMDSDKLLDMEKLMFELVLCTCVMLKRACFVLCLNEPVFFAVSLLAI